MEKLREIAKKELDKVPENIREMYEIKMADEWIAIGSPAYVNVDYEEYFMVDEDDVTWRFINSKVAVTIFKDHGYMHVTVL